MPKTIISLLQSKIRKIEKKLGTLKKYEAKAREKWTKNYGKFLDAVKELTGLKRHGTKKEAKLCEKVNEWPEKSVDLTKGRDVAREEIKKAEQELNQLKVEIARVIAQDESERKANDEIVEQVFMLNNKVVEALETRNDYLSKHVYKMLFDEKGNLRSQVTFDNSSGTRRVRAMVNTITIVRPDLAADAQRKIQEFFDRFQKKAAMDDHTKALYELTKKLLIEKTSFKVGPDLYRFLVMEFEEQVFPELAEAQRLLKMSIRSEKTNSYIRLYKRENSASNWQPIKQG